MEISNFRASGHFNFEKKIPSTLYKREETVNGMWNGNAKGGT